jgi:hypothetical protein
MKQRGVEMLRKCKGGKHKQQQEQVQAQDEE